MGQGMAATDTRAAGNGRAVASMHGMATGTLADVPPPRWKAGAAVAVVMASAGYPETSSKGVAMVIMPFSRTARVSTA